MSSPVLVSVPYRFYEASLFVHGAEYLFICPFIHPANLPILLHTHISKAFKRFISSFLMVHVSHPYRTTGLTSILTNLFLRTTLILLVSSSFLLLNASFAIPILVLTSSKYLLSSEINELRYLNLLSCSTL